MKNAMKYLIVSLLLVASVSCGTLVNHIRVTEQLLDHAVWKKFTVDELGISYLAPDQRVRPGSVATEENLTRYGCKTHSFWLNEVKIYSMYEQLDLIYITMHRFDPANWKRFLIGDVPANSYRQSDEDISHFYPKMITHKAVVAPMAASGVFFRKDIRTPDGGVLSATAFYRNIEGDPERRKIHMETITKILNSIEVYK